MAWVQSIFLDTLSLINPQNLRALMSQVNTRKEGLKGENIQHKIHFT